MQQMEEKYRKICKRVQKVCQKYREHYGKNFDKHNKTSQLLLPVKDGFYLNIMFDKAHKLAYCPHTKDASSNLRNYFLKLSPPDVKEMLEIKDMIKSNKSKNLHQKSSCYLLNL